MNNVDNPTPAVELFATGTDVESTKAINGTIYQNTSSKPLFGILSLNLPAGVCSMDFQYGTTAGAGDVYANLATGALSIASTVSVSYVIPSGYYYKFVIGSGAVSVSHWIEIQ